jgi:hypothetical protein
MTDVAALRTPAWTMKSKAMHAQLIFSGPKIKPNLSAETLEAITMEAISLSQTSLIGIAPTKHPLRLELQDWVNMNLVEPCMLVTRICILQRGYFVLTFTSEEGAASAFHMSFYCSARISCTSNPGPSNLIPLNQKG